MQLKNDGKWAADGRSWTVQVDGDFDKYPLLRDCSVLIGKIDSGVDKWCRHKL